MNRAKGTFGTRHALALLATSLAAAPAAAQTPWTFTPSDPGAISTEPWTGGANAFGWIVNAPANIETPRGKVFLPEDFSTIIDSLNFAAMMEFEAKKGPLTLIFSPIVYSGDFTEGVRLGGVVPGDFKVSEDVILLDFGVSYEVGTIRMGSGANAIDVSVAPYLGFQYFYDDLAINLRSLPTGAADVEIDETLEYWTPLIGINTIWTLSDDWRFRLRANYGGFGGGALASDALDYTWEVFGAFVYEFDAFDSPAHAFVGYRHKEVVGDANANGVAIDFQVSGPVIGFGLRF